MYDNEYNFSFQVNVTAESARGLVEDIASVLSDTKPEDQTSDNLDTVANVLQDVVGLLNEDANFTVDEDVSLAQEII